VKAHLSDNNRIFGGYTPLKWNPKESKKWELKSKIKSP
jgi:hypothetical protein